MTNAKDVHSTTPHAQEECDIQSQTEPIIIRNPSPELIKFLDAWKKRQRETLKRVVEKYKDMLK